MPYTWIIDVESRSVEVFKLQGSRYSLWQIFSGEEPVAAEPFEAVPLELALLWTVD